MASTHKSRVNTLPTPRTSRPSKRSRSKDKSKNSGRERVYGVRKNSISRSLSDIPSAVSGPKGSTVCYITPKPVTPVPSPCPEIVVTNDDEDSESLKYKFIRAVKEVIKTRVQSASSRREYAKMKEEKETKDNVGRAEIVVVEEEAYPRIPRIQSEPTILSFPFEADDNSNTVNGQPCQHEECIEALVLPRRKSGARLCMLSAVCRMKELTKRKPKSIEALKRNPITTADEKLMREQKEAENDEHPDSEDESVNDPMAYLRGCTYLRGTNEDKELSLDEIFH